MYLNKKMLLSSACGLSVAMVSPAFAQDDSPEPSTNQTQITNTPGAQDDTYRTGGNPLPEQNNQTFDQRNRQYQTRRPVQGQYQNQGQYRSQSQFGNRGQQGSSQYQLTPEGWARIAVDYDNDGKFDSLETISIYELERAQEASRQQSSRDRDGAMRERHRVQLTGTVQSLEPKSMIGQEQKNMVAQIQTSEGETQKVCLGAQDKLSKLNLKEGSEVQIEGVRARMNGEEHIIAESVSANNETVKNEIPRRRGLARVKGQITATRETTFHGHDDKFVIAQVEVEEGQAPMQVNLGPAKKFEGTELKEGTEIRVLGHRGRMNDQPALIAEKVRVNDKTIDVMPQDSQSKQDESTPEGQTRNNAEAQKPSDANSQRPENATQNR
ncbi:MAG: hypothetical protein CMJ46_04895 [Planctomyces sp.]|nr:hypothetical protein [Planctomyces sp.]